MLHIDGKSLELLHENYIENKKTWTYGDGAVLACLLTEVTQQDPKEILSYEPWFEGMGSFSKGSTKAVAHIINTILSPVMKKDDHESYTKKHALIGKITESTGLICDEAESLMDAAYAAVSAEKLKINNPSVLQKFLDRTIMVLTPIAGPEKDHEAVSLRLDAIDEIKDRVKNGMVLRAVMEI